MCPAVFFFIDPEIMDDPQLKNVRCVALCYTCFFRLIGMNDYEEERDDEEEEAAYNLEYIVL